jgi:heme/copper-type cytochrome/quinol oxidase subunit 4
MPNKTSVSSYLGKHSVGFCLSIALVCLAHSSIARVLHLISTADPYAHLLDNLIFLALAWNFIILILTTIGIRRSTLPRGSPLSAMLYHQSVGYAVVTCMTCIPMAVSLYYVFCISRVAIAKWPSWYAADYCVSKSEWYVPLFLVYLSLVPARYVERYVIIGIINIIPAIIGKHLRDSLSSYFYHKLLVLCIQVQQWRKLCFLPLAFHFPRWRYNNWHL